MTIGVVGTPLDTIKNLRDASKSKGTFNEANKIGQEIGASALTAPQVAMSFGSSSSNSTSCPLNRSTAFHSLHAIDPLVSYGERD